jgi:hypothetical protein
VPQASTMYMQIANLNQLRLSVSQINPATCQHSTAHSAGSMLSHSFALAMTRRGAGGGGAVMQQSIQSVCRFELLPFKEPLEEDCDDPRKARTCMHTSEPCYGRTYQKLIKGCKKSCGFCGVCKDKRTKKECHAWSLEAQCLKNPGFMQTACPKTCNFCGVLYDPQPPHWVALWNGLLMPTLGFGTAGLGEGTERAVSMALRLGVRSLDSAQARAWYREDLVGKVQSISLHLQVVDKHRKPTRICLCLILELRVW